MDTANTELRIGLGFQALAFFPKEMWPKVVAIFLERGIVVELTSTTSGELSLLVNPKDKEQVRELLIKDPDKKGTLAQQYGAILEEAREKFNPPPSSSR
jgi:hypothetical protein